MSGDASNRFIRLKVKWSPELLKEVFWLSMGSDGDDARKSFRKKMALVFISFAIVLVLLIYPNLSNVPTNLLWFALGFLMMAALVTFIYIPALKRLRVARAMSSPLTRGWLLVTLRKSGVTVKQDASFTAFDWEAILEIRKGALASYLFVDEALAVPIPHGAKSPAESHMELLLQIRKLMSEA